MIEIIYNETKKGTTGNDEIFHIPNNIRQIGESKDNLKIYMEDYAYTFLKRMSRQDTENGCAAVLLGEAKWKDSVSYIFIRSVLKIEEPDINAEHMPFSDSVWGEIHKDIEKYFPEQEVIGWSLSLPGFNMKINDIILRAHLDHFAGNQKALFVMEPGEKEESFFMYESNQMARQNGFYIYYEKNEPMQSYMIEKCGNNSIEETEHVSDRAVIDFRKIVSGKKEQQSQGFTKRLLYGVSACSIVVLLAFGITFFNNYTKMEDTVGKISGEVKEPASKAVNSDAAQETPKPAKDQARDAAAKEETEQGKTPESSGGNKTAQDLTEQSSDTENKDEDSAKATQTPAPKVADGGAQEQTKVNKDEKQGPQDASKTTDTTMPKNDTPTNKSADTKGQETTTKAYKRYIVKQGDTLTHISEQHYGTIFKLEEICKANNMAAEDIIYAGQEIVLP